MSRRTARRSIGVAVALFGLFALFGGLFVPIGVILQSPAVVPAPESWIFGWVTLVGVVVALWPGSARSQR